MDIESAATQAQFNHVGTTREYLHHFCYNETLREACQFGVETAVAENGTGTREKSLEEPKPKKAKTDVKFEECSLIHTVFADRTRYVTTLKSVPYLHIHSILLRVVYK